MSTKMNLEDLMEELRKNYKNMMKEPPSHDEVVIIVRPRGDRPKECLRFFGKYDAFTQQIHSYTHKRPVPVTDMTYWLPLPGVPDVLLDYEPPKELTYIEFYDKVTAKRRGFPKINEIYRCELYLRQNGVILYGTGFNPSKKEIDRLKDKIGAFFKRERIESPGQIDIFRYFLFCYEQQLLKKQIYDYDQLVYRSSHIR